MGLQSPILLSSGSIARYPLSTKETFRTLVNKFADDSRQTAALRAFPLSQWVVNLTMLQDSEASDWKDLFEAVLAGYAPFSFIDPWDNLLQYSEQQETSPWAATSLSAVATSAIADPFGATASGRIREVTVTTFGTATLNQSVAILPAGTGASRSKGLTLTASIWVQQVAPGGPAFSLVLTDTSSSESSSKVVTPTGAWQRVSVTHTFSQNNIATGVSFALNSFSANGSVYVFGAQLEVEGTPSGYKSTTTYCGYHPKCFFQTDEMDRQASEFNQNTVQLVIEESS